MKCAADPIFIVLSVPSRKYGNALHDGVSNPALLLGELLCNEIDMQLHAAYT